MKVGELAWPQGMTVYVDMDGVLADFEAGYKKQFGRLPSGESKDDPNIGRLVGTDFFNTLPKYDTADALIQLVLDHAGSYSICTAPLRNDHKNSGHWKREWLAQHISPAPRQIKVNGQKEVYAVGADGVPNVLIDDKPKNIQRWRAAGGIAVEYYAPRDGLDVVARGLRQAAQWQPDMVKESATGDLEKDLKDPLGYDAIDHMMQTISRRHGITANRLHDLFVAKHGCTPDHWIRQGMAEDLEEAVGGNYLYHATMPAGIMRILRDGLIKASWRPQEATKAKTKYPTVSTTRSKQYAESDNFVNFLNLTKDGNAAIMVFDRNAVANHYKMFSTSQGTQNVGDEYEEVIVVPKGAMPIRGTLKGFYFNPKRAAEIEEYKDVPWFQELLKSPYYLGPRQGVAEGLEVDVPNERWIKQGVTEGRSSGYKEIEFICANPKFPNATDPKLQKQMYAGLKQIPGVIPLFQDQSDYSEGQYSLTAIYKDRDVRGQILKLAKQLGVKVDLEQPVTDDYVDRAIRGEHEGQQGMAEDAFNGIEVTMEVEDDEIMVRATAGGRELGHVLFVQDNGYLMPQDLEVNERFRGQGIAATMYDYVKSQGYKIRRSGQQTDAGAGFWAKHRPEQNVWEQHTDNNIGFKIQKGKNKFATTMYVDNNPAGVYQFDADTGRSIAEVYPEFKGQGFGKLLVLHAIYTAAKLGLNFQEDESRTSEYDNVLDSLSSNGYIVDDDGYWYVTGEGEQYLKQSLKQGVAEGLEVDVPNERWLQNKIDYAKRKGRTSYGVPYMGTTTAYTSQNTRVPMDILRQLLGMRGEQKNVRQDNLKALVKIMKDTGRLPMHQGQEYAPFINVAWNGEAWVNEGNHRIMAAAALGWKDLPVQIRYFDGGERVKSGVMYPGRIGLGNIKENFADGRGPGRPGDSKRHGIKKGVTLAQLDQIVHSKTASPRKKQLAHWAANMRRGQAKKK